MKIDSRFAEYSNLSAQGGDHPTTTREKPSARSKLRLTARTPNNRQCPGIDSS